MSLFFCDKETKSNERPQHRKTPFRAIPAAECKDSDAWQFSAATSQVVNAILLPELDK